MLEIDKPQSAGVRDAINQLRSRMNVGRLIVRYRMRHRWSQQDLAARAGTKQSRVSELETLGGNVRFDTLDKIVTALGLEVTLQERSITIPAVLPGWGEAFVNISIPASYPTATAITSTAYIPTVETQQVANAAA
jgi:transcriptional regulator with XRE-family HTH domain